MSLQIFDKKSISDYLNPTFLTCVKKWTLEFSIKIIFYIVSFSYMFWKSLGYIYIYKPEIILPK